MIPNEAVEAAARKLAACYGVVDFDGLDEYQRNEWLDLIRKAATDASP